MVNIQKFNYCATIFLVCYHICSMHTNLINTTACFSLRGPLMIRLNNSVEIYCPRDSVLNQSYLRNYLLLVYNGAEKRISHDEIDYVADGAGELIWS